MYINKEELGLRFAKSINSYDKSAIAQQKIIKHLDKKLQELNSINPSSILEIGCGTGMMTKTLHKRYQHASIYINDLHNNMCQHTAKQIDSINETQFIIGDIESIAIKHTFDLIVSTSTFQWLTNRTSTFAKLADKLNANGHLVFSTFGKQNFKELKMITGEGLEYVNIQKLQEELTPYFDILYCDEQEISIHFETILSLLSHIKETGVGTLPRQNTQSNPHQHSSSNNNIKSIINGFSQFKSANNTYPLTYHPQYIICRKKVG